MLGQRRMAWLDADSKQISLVPIAVILVACTGARSDLIGVLGDEENAGDNDVFAEGAGGLSSSSGGLSSSSGGLSSSSGGLSPGSGGSASGVGGATREKAQSGGTGTGGSRSMTSTGGLPGVSSGGALMTGGNAGMGGANEPMGGLIEPTFESLKLMMRYSPNGVCSAACCHGRQFTGRERLSLVDDDGLYERLTTYVSDCENLKLVEPGSPDNSALVKLLKGSCGDIGRMPAGCIEGENCFPEEWVLAIEEWIEKGAPEN